MQSSGVDVVSRSAPKTTGMQNEWHHKDASKDLKSSYFEADKYAAELIRGKKSLVHGLVIPCAWSWCDNDPETERQYRQLVSNIRELTARYSGVRNKFFCYNGSTLHCTIATLFSFKDTTPISEEIQASDSSSDPLAVVSPQLHRNRIFEVWSEVIGDHMAKPSNRLAVSPEQVAVPFSLELSSIEVSKSACLFHCRDKLGLIEHIRGVVRVAAEDPRLRAVEAELGLENRCLSDHISVPGIIHSTFARYDQIVFRCAQEEGKFIDELRELCNAWVPREVESKEFHLVHEYHPYMQMQKRLRSAASARNGSGDGVVASPIIATFRMQDMLIDASVPLVAAASPAPVDQHTSSTPCTTGGENELTLTPLSPMYHQYIHPAEDAALGGVETPFKLASGLTDESELFLTPLSDQLDSTAGSRASLGTGMSQDRGWDKERGSSHLVQSFVAQGTLFSPVVGSPADGKAVSSAISGPAPTQTTAIEPASMSPPAPTGRSNWLWVSAVCGGVLIALAGTTALLPNRYRHAWRELCTAWNSRLRDFFDTLRLM